jgi:predicted RNA-binding Zn ribbon-like protein
MPDYAGPIRGEPLAIELHNTLYADRGAVADGLASDAGLRAWLAALGDRLPVDPGAVDPGRLDDFRSLRDAVREALHAALEGRSMSDDALAELNRRSAASPESLELTQRDRERSAQVRHHAPTASDVALGAIAASAIALVSGPDAGALRACGAPGCVLAFVKDHPRREWCSPACGNRARQARHYARSRDRVRRGGSE